MTRDELEQMTRKELLAMLPEGHGFSPVSSKKSDIIDAILALADAPDAPPTEQPSDAEVDRIVAGLLTRMSGETLLHGVLRAIDLVLVDPFGQEFPMHPDKPEKVRMTDFPEPTGINEWQWFTKPIKFGSRAYDVYNPNGLLAR